MGKTHKKQRAETASANKSAAAKARWANAAAAEVLEALGAGAGEVCAPRGSNDYVHGSLLPTQAVRSDAVDGRLSYLPLRPEHGGGASVRLAPWGGLRPGVGPVFGGDAQRLVRLRPPPSGKQLLASFCRLIRSHPLHLPRSSSGGSFPLISRPHSNLCAPV